MSARRLAFKLRRKALRWFLDSRYGRPTHRFGACGDTGNPLLSACCEIDRRDLMDVVTTTVGLTDLKFRLVREDFADAVAWVARNLPNRPTVPVLAGVLLTGSDEGLTISGFDYEVSAEVQVAAEIASPGSVLVSGRLLSDITRALPAKPVDVSVEGTRVSLTCGSARFSLPTMAVEDYPTLPALPDETGCHLRRSVRRGDRPGGGCRRPRRHAADADRYPRRNFRRKCRFGGHRPVPARGA